MKKLLALVLALVMSMSLVTISNADFKDADEISYKEAVEVMAAVGVIKGYDNGDFGAKDTLTRAQATKIIAYLDLGEKVAEALPAVQVYSDVPASHWAAKYIAYCADAGYVSGVGDNKFAPDEKVTGYQFGKMLLAVLGYDATIEQMTGASWQIKVAALMEKNDINDGVDAYASAYLTREEAAQYALNALEAIYVDYDNKGTDINLGDIGSITVGASKAEKNDANETLYQKLYKTDLKKTANTTDAFGRPATKWEYDGEEVGTYAKTPDVTFTGKATEKEVYNALNGEDGTLTVKEVYEDGYDKGSMSYSKTVTNNAPYFGNGIKVEAYEIEDASGDYWRLVAVRDYLGEVTKVNKADTKNDVDRSIEVTLTVDAEGYGKKCVAYETEDFAKDDVVVVNVSVKSGEIVVKSIKLAETVKDVAVTAYKQGGADKASVTAGGETYSYSQNNTATPASKTYSIGSSTTYTLTLDTMGNILKVDTYKASASTDYVYVIKTQFQNNASDLIDDNAQAAKADVIFTDGTHKTINLSIDDKSTDEIDDDTVMFPYVAGDVGEVKISDVTSKADGKRTIGNWFAYTVNDDGTYDLEALDSKYAATATNVELTKDKSVAVASGKYTTSATKIVTIDKDYKLSSSTGFTSKDTTLSGKILYTYAEDAKVIDSIYAVNAEPVVDSVEYAYAVKAGNTVQYGTEWVFAIGGEQVTYVISGTAPVEGNVYELSSAKNDTYTVGTSLKDTTADANKVEVEVVDDDMFIDTTGNGYYFADDCGIYNVDEDDASVVGEVDTLVDGDKVVVITNTESEVVAVYIVLAD